MEDGRSPCLLLPKYKRRKVSAIRDFPEGLKQLPDVVDLKSTKGQACGSQDDLKATGLDNMLSCDTEVRKVARIVDSEEKGVHQLSSKRKCDFPVVEVIRDYPKGFKQIPEDVDPKSKRNEFCGSENMKELKRCSEKVVPKAKGDKACLSKNENFKSIKLHETSIEYEKEVDSEGGVNRFASEQQCDNGDKNKVSEFENKPSYQSIGDFSSSVVIDGVKSQREEQKPDSEQDVDHCSEKQRVFDSGNVLRSKESTKCQDIGSSLNACNQTGVNGNRHRTLPKRRRVSAVRDFPPALVRIVFNSGPLGKGLLVDKGASNDHLGMVGCISSNSATMIEPKYGMKDVEVDGQSCIPDEPCMNMGNQEFDHPSGRSSAAVKDVQESACQLDGADNMVRCTTSNGATVIEPKYGIKDVEVDGLSCLPDKSCMNMENQEFYNPTGRSLPAVNDVQESDCQLQGPDNMVECTTSNGATMIEPKYGTNDVEVNGQSRIPDEPCMNMENQEVDHPSGHSSAAVNDVEESACQLDGPDNMFYLAPTDIASFFSDDCCNGFLFEDDV